MVQGPRPRVPHSRAHAQGRPPNRYAVRLEVLIEGAWRTIHLFDNAHGRHDEHDYLGEDKQPAREFFFGAATGALPAAIELLDSRWAAIIQRWSERQR